MAFTRALASSRGALVYAGMPQGRRGCWLPCIHTAVQLGAVCASGGK